MRSPSPSIFRPEPPTPRTARRGSIEALMGLAVKPQVVCIGKGADRTSLPPLAEGKMHVVDLFCGIGGFSTGATQADHRVVLAVDCCEMLLRCHQQNHPNTRHLLMTLGPETEDALIEQVRAAVPHGEPWHLHGSPPCTNLSMLQAPRREDGRRTHEGDVDKGMPLVIWYLMLVVRLRPTTWSFEQVGMQEVWGALRMMQALYPSLVSFVKQLDFGDYGVGQQRKRCIAGSPALIARILNDESLHARAPTMRELLPNPPEGAEQVKASTGKCPDPEQTVENEDGTFTNPTIYHKCYRTLDEVAFSCVAAHPHYWATADFVTIQPFSAREQALLQSFPADYVLPTVKVHSNLGTGNAIPPLFIRKLMS